MLIQLITQQPQVLAPILRNTPTWVWGLLTALLALGLSQVRTRQVSAIRMAAMPVAMTGLSLWGTISAFSSSPSFGYVLLAWTAGAATLAALIAPTAAPRGAAYDAGGRSFTVPGSWVPLALIVGIFLTKYFIGVELAMQPALAADSTYSLVAGGLYGVFSGAFAGRAARFWKLALQTEPVSATAALRA